MAHNRNSKGSSGDGDRKPEVTPEARRKQVILGLVMGAIVGAVIGMVTGFWWWLPAGLAFGLAVGFVMRPPA